MNLRLLQHLPRWQQGPAWANEEEQRKRACQQMPEKINNATPGSDASPNPSPRLWIGAVMGETELTNGFLPGLL